MKGEKTHKYTIELPMSLWKQLTTRIGKGNIKDYVITSIVQQLKRQQLRTVILCGGEGFNKAFRSIQIPSVMLALGYKPILQYSVEMLHKFNIQQIIMLPGPHKDIIGSYFGEGGKFHVEIDYITEPEPLGTAGAVKHAQPHITTRFIVLNGDIITNVNISDFLAVHEKHVAEDENTIGTIFLIEGEMDITKLPGRVLLDNDTGRIKKFFDGQKEQHDNSYLNGGIYIFEPRIFDIISSGKRIGFEKDIFPSMANNGQLYGYFTSQKNFQWVEITTDEDYQKAWRTYLDGNLTFK